MVNAFPIVCPPQPHADAMRRDFSERQVVGLADLRHATVLDAVGFEFTLAENGRIRRLFREVEPIITSHKPKVR